MLYQLLEAYVTTEYRNGCVYKTQKVAQFYAPVGVKYPETIGDLRICPTSAPYIERDKDFKKIEPKEKSK